MGQELATGIALCTTWAGDDLDTWRQLALDAIAHDSLDVVGELSHIAVQLAKAISAVSEDGWSVEQVLQQLAISAEQDDDGA